MIKKTFLVLASLFFLTGCGSDDGTVTTPSSDATQFSYMGINMQIELPDSWQALPLPADPDEVFLAQRDTHNLAILSRSMPTNENFATDFIAKAEEEFFFFKPIETFTSRWTFQGKLDIADPLRVFYQEALPLTGTNTMLLASCSVPTQDAENNNCQSILNSWIILALE